MNRKYILSFFLLIINFNNSFAQSWTSLFDGKSLAGWVQRGGNAYYKVEDGSIVGYSRLSTLNSFLCTNETYRDFILEFEFLVDNDLNSGVQIRSHISWFYKKGRVYGKQFEIDPSVRAWTGGIYDESRRGWLYPLAENEHAQNAFKNGQWNKARIEAIGSRIRTWVNGIPCSDLIDDADLEGFIALQVHTIGTDLKKEGKTVRWRNIRICTDEVERFIMPENTGITQVYAKDPDYSIKDVISKREFFMGLLAIICISLGVVSMRKITRNLNQDNDKEINEKR